MPPMIRSPVPSSRRRRLPPADVLPVRGPTAVRRRDRRHRGGPPQPLPPLRDPATVPTGDRGGGGLGPIHGIRNRRRETGESGGGAGTHPQGHPRNRPLRGMHAQHLTLTAGSGGQPPSARGGRDPLAPPRGKFPSVFLSIPLQGPFCIESKSLFSFGLRDYREGSLFCPSSICETLGRVALLICFT